MAESADTFEQWTWSAWDVLGTEEPELWSAWGMSSSVGPNPAVASHSRVWFDETTGVTDSNGTAQPVTWTEQTQNTTDDPLTPTDVSQVDALSAAFKFLVAVLILTVNTLTIVTFCRKRALRTLSNMLVVSLAVTDLLVGVILFLGALNWVPALHVLISTSGPFCAARLGGYFACCATSMLNISLIALERYLYITHPYIHQTCVSAKVVGACICAVWTGGILFGIGPVFVYNYTPQHKCDIYYMLGPLYSVYAVLGMFVFTSVPTLVFYSLIARLVLQKRSQAAPDGAHWATCPPAPSTGGGQQSRLSRDPKLVPLKNKLRALKAPVVVFGVFFLSWSPHIITYLVHDLMGEISRTTRASISNLAFSNSAMNFFVYLALNSQFRRAALFGLCRSANEVNSEFSFHGSIQPAARNLHDVSGASQGTTPAATKIFSDSTPSITGAPPGITSDNNGTSPATKPDVMALLPAASTGVTSKTLPHIVGSQANSICQSNI